MTRDVLPMPCTHCVGTGSLMKRLDGPLDCGHCNAATMRATLNSWARAQDERGEALNWRIYLAGMKMGIECR